MGGRVLALPGPPPPPPAAVVYCARAVRGLPLPRRLRPGREGGSLRGPGVRVRRGEKKMAIF